MVGSDSGRAGRTPRSRFKGVPKLPKGAARTGHQHGAATQSGGSGGGHSPHQTGAGGKGSHAAGAHRAAHGGGRGSGAILGYDGEPTPTLAIEVNFHLHHSSLSHPTGTGIGRGGAHIPAGHHPLANGKAPLPATTHIGAHRRATILSYNSAANTAIVRYGDTPDSPTATINVSPMISAAVMGAATMAGVVLWDDADPTDALITAVL